MKPHEVHQADSFHLEIDGISKGSFVRCSGLGAEIGRFQYREGGFDGVRQFREDTTWSNILLERGVASGQELYEWFMKGDRRDGAVVLLSPSGAEVLRWEFERGWPCRWDGPVLDAQASEVALESLEIAHEGLRCLRRDVPR